MTTALAKIAQTVFMDTGLGPAGRPGMTEERPCRRLETPAPAGKNAGMSAAPALAPTKAPRDENFPVASLLLARHPQPYSPSSSTDAYDTQAATRPRDLASWESALSGACAGASYNLALFPADTVKSTMQTEAELRPGSAPAGGGRRSFWGVGREMYRAQGIRGLYAGCGVTVARSIPSSAVIFWIYDGLKARYG